ncbi:MAG: hypothetical protein GY940_38665 [bacterium]|nr:hypothetical protein [bacterium]
MIKPIIIPDFYPAIQRMEVTGGKIYAMTFRKDDKKNVECVVLDKAGKLLKTVFLQLEARNNADLYPYTIYDGKTYQLVETEDEDWALHVKKI